MYNFQATGKFLTQGIWKMFEIKGTASSYEEARKMSEKMKRKYVTKYAFIKIIKA